MKKNLLTLSFLILMTGVSFAQEVDEKIPLLDESMITPNQEIPAESKKPIEKDESIKKEPEVKIEPSTITLTPEPEEGTLTSTHEPEEGTVTPPLATSTTHLIETSIHSTSTVDVGTFTLEQGTQMISTADGGSKGVDSTFSSEQGTLTSPVGTLSTTLLTGTLTSGTTSLEVGSPTSKWIGTLSNTGLILVPTAYRRNDKKGFNIDAIIAYYIGDLWHSMNGGEFFNPIKFLFLSGDFKYSLLKEKEIIPHFGAGYEWFLVLKGGASSASQMGGEFSGKSDRFGYPYFVFSKKFKHLNCHCGMMFGELDKLFNPLSEFVTLDSKKALIFGIDTKLFNRKINIEGISPLGSGFHLLLNTSIERFVGFDLSFMKSPDGLSIMGYFGIRFTIFPYIKDKK